MLNNIVPIFWNKIDGRFCIFFIYKFTHTHIDNKNLISMSVEKLFRLIKEDENEGFHDNIYYISQGVVSDLSNYHEINKIWKLAGWLIPFSDNEITLNNTMREQCSYQDLSGKLIGRCLVYKFRLFREIWKRKLECKNTSKRKNDRCPLWLLNEDIIYNIMNILFNPGLWNIAIDDDENKIVSVV